MTKYSRHFSKTKVWFPLKGVYPCHIKSDPTSTVLLVEVLLQIQRSLVPHSECPELGFTFLYFWLIQNCTTSKQSVSFERKIEPWVYILILEKCCLEGRFLPESNFTNFTKYGPSFVHLTFWKKRQCILFTFHTLTYTGAEGAYMLQSGMPEHIASSLIFSLDLLMYQGRRGS